MAAAVSKSVETCSFARNMSSATRRSLAALMMAAAFCPPKIGQKAISEDCGVAEATT